MAQATGPVLVVDDDADSRGFLELIVGTLGFDVLTAADGAQALELAREHRPSLILLDVMMPVCDGFSFREAQLRTPELADIPVILISALPESQILRLRLNGAAAIGKPINIEELKMQVVAICAPHGDEARRA